MSSLIPVGLLSDASLFELSLIKPSTGQQSCLLAAVLLGNLPDPGVHVAAGRGRDARCLDALVFGVGCLCRRAVDPPVLGDELPGCYLLVASQLGTFTWSEEFDLVDLRICARVVLECESDIGDVHAMREIKVELLMFVCEV